MLMVRKLMDAVSLSTLKEVAPLKVGCHEDLVSYK